MPTLLTFGDSNTHGTKPIVTPGDMHRFGADTRWPTMAKAALGPDWELVEEGLPGRTTQFCDPVMGDEMDGKMGLKIALKSHGPIDVLTIMLGTNDLKTRFAPTPHLICGGIAGLLDIALSAEMQDRHNGFEILVICPPPILEQGPIADQFFGGCAVSEALTHPMAQLAGHRRVGFLNSGDHISVSPQDGIHWEAESHMAFGPVVAGAVATL